MYGGSGAPANWLLCDGTAVSRTAFPALFSIISTSYGAGDGTSTFNLPNFKQKVAVGQDISTTWALTLGQAGGEVNHTLSVAEMAAHNHSVSATQGTHTHGDSGHNHYCSGVDHLHGVNGVDHLHPIGAGQFNHNHGDPGHQHTVDINTYNNFGIGAGLTACVPNVGTAIGTYAAGTGIQATTLPAGGTGAADRSLNTTSNAADRSLAFWANIAYAAISTVSAGAISIAQSTIGSNTAHNNLQPYLVVNYIIKT
jgi:microcystin-dependent protein